MDKRLLVLWLEAPLQSWGTDSLFGRRDTQDFPSKSGIIGMLIAAMGKRGPQSELLKELSTQVHTVFSFIREQQSSVLLRDFHMVGSGYDHEDPWQNLFIPKTVEGRPAVGGGSKMTYRYYLRDAFFGVVIEGKKDLIKRCGEALKNPVFTLSLGRKTCIPTEFVYQGLFQTFDEAKERVMMIASEKGLILKQTILEGEYEGDTFSVNDVPVRFGIRKTYRDRMVTVIDK